jgi:hypothetical protein
VNDLRPIICPQTFILSYEGKRKVEDRSFGKTFNGSYGLQGVYFGDFTHADLMDRLRNHFTHSPDTTVDLVFKDDSGEKYRVSLNSRIYAGFHAPYGDNVIVIRPAPNIPYDLPRNRKQP